MMCEKSHVRGNFATNLWFCRTEVNEKTAFTRPRPCAPGIVLWLAPEAPGSHSYLGFTQPPGVGSGSVSGHIQRGEREVPHGPPWERGVRSWWSRRRRRPALPRLLRRIDIVTASLNLDRDARTVRPVWCCSHLSRYRDIESLRLRLRSQGHL